jgi:hypothetical protein
MVAFSMLWSDPSVFNEKPAAQFSSVGGWNSSSKSVQSQWFVNCCTKIYKGPVNLIIRSKTHASSHGNPGYVTVWTDLISRLKFLWCPKMRFFQCFRLKFLWYPEKRLFRWPWLKYYQSPMLCLFSWLRLRLLSFRFYILIIYETYGSEFCGWFTFIKSKLLWSVGCLQLSIKISLSP